MKKLSRYLTFDPTSLKKPFKHMKWNLIVCATTLSY